MQLRSVICLFTRLLVLSSSTLHAQVFEPKQIKSVDNLKPNDGIVRLSLRSQRQYIETAFMYFVEVQPDGSDGTRTLRFERGAGVPVLGTNMIDVKPKYYRVPQGKYRLLAYTVACDTLPPMGKVCAQYGRTLPIEHYTGSSLTFEVAARSVTDAGDFVIEYTNSVDLDYFDLMSDRYSDKGYGVRWRAIKEPILAAFTAVPLSPPPHIDPSFVSRIECDQRPKDKLIQFPFRCPAAVAH